MFHRWALVGVGDMCLAIFCLNNRGVGIFTLRTFKIALKFQQVVSVSFSFSFQFSTRLAAVFAEEVGDFGFLFFGGQI